MRSWYKLAEMATVIPWQKKRGVVILGDGPNKSKFVWRRESFVSLGLNRVPLVVPCDFGVGLYNHFDYLAEILPCWVPLVVISKWDILSQGLKLTNYGTGVAIAEYFCRHLPPDKRIILQGFDISRPAYREQLSGFFQLSTAYPGRIAIPLPGILAEYFPVVPPVWNEII